MYGMQLDTMEQKLYNALKSKASPGRLIDISLQDLATDAGFTSHGGMHTKSMRMLEAVGLVAKIDGEGYIVLR